MPRCDNYSLQGLLAYTGVQDDLVRDGGRDCCHLRLGLFQWLALQLFDYAALRESTMSKDHIQQEASSQIASVWVAPVLRIYTEIGQLGLRVILYRPFRNDLNA